MTEKVDAIFKFKEEIQDTVFKQRAKFSEFEKKVNNDIDVINKILSNTVIYPSMIGKTAKFKTFHEFIDFTNKEINQLNIFKNKSGIDLAPYKKKIDGALEAFKIQMNNLTPKETTNQMVNELEEKILNNLKLYDDKIQDIRVENSRYSVGIKRTADEMEGQIESLKNVQKYINKKFEKINGMENYNLLNNEMLEIDHKINKIFDILRELISYHPDVKRSFPEFEKKITKTIISGVKQYIKGNLNAEELASMKKFSYEKSKVQFFDNNSVVKKSSQIMSDGPTLYKFPQQKRQSIYLDLKPVNIDGENLDFISKNFTRKKTTNFSTLNQINTNDNKKIEKPQKFIRGISDRKSTFSFGKNTYFEASKTKSNSMRKANNIKNVFPNEEKDNNIIEEENEVNNISNNSNHESNENKFQPFLDNENNNSDRIQSVKSSIMKNQNEKREKTLKKDNKAIFKKNNSDEKVKTENNKNNDYINIKEKERNNNINVNKVNNKIKNTPKKADEKGKITLLTTSNRNNDNKTEIKINDNKNQAKEINKKIIDEKELINDRVRKIKTLTTKNDPDKSDIILETYNNKNNETKNNNPIIAKLDFKKNVNKKHIMNSFSLEKEKKIHIIEGNKLLIPINYNFTSINPDISIISIKKKFYKTYSNFPKINHDLSENKIRMNPTERRISTKTKNENKNVTNINYSFKYKNKILSLNPDNLPLNYFDKA